MDRPSLEWEFRRSVGTGAELGKLTAFGHWKRHHWNRLHYGTNGNRIRYPVGAPLALRYSTDLVDRSEIPSRLRALETVPGSLLSLGGTPLNRLGHCWRAVDLVQRPADGDLSFGPKRLDPDCQTSIDARLRNRKRQEASSHQSQ